MIVKNVDVVKAFYRGEEAAARHLRSTGSSLFSYALQIATLDSHGNIIILRQKVSKTTSGHINLAIKHCPGATVVDV